MKKDLFIMAGAMIAALSLGACSEDDTHGVDLSKPISLFPAGSGGDEGDGGRGSRREFRDE